jgi:hypothetical protein
VEFSSNANLGKLEEKLKFLEIDKEKLIKDNITLIRENDYLKEQINVTMKEEHERLMQFNNDR